MDTDVRLEWCKQDNGGYKIHESLQVYEILNAEQITKSRNNKSGYILNPQGIVNVILCRKNESEIQTKDDEFGLLFSKIGEYRKGLWIIEPGFVHPNYDCFLSVHVCNLSKVPIPINIGDSLVEMVKFKSQSPETNLHNKDHDCEKYINIRRSEAFIYPDTFLDLEVNVNKIKDEVGIKPFGYMLALLLTFFAAIVGTAGWVNWDVGNQIRDAVVDQIQLVDDDVKVAIDKNIKLEKHNLEREIEILKKRVGELEGGKQ